MGYRHYFYTADIDEIEKIKNMSYLDLESYAESKGILEITDYGDGEIEKYLPFKNLCNQKEVFEFGKLYYEDTDTQIYGTGNPLFENIETQKYFEDYNPYVVGKDGLLKAINIYNEKIKEYYKQLFDDGAVQILPFGIEISRDDIKTNDKIHKHIKDMMTEWFHDWVLNLDENRQVVTSSWKYEYSIFNLVFLLKTINWEKQTLLFYGW